MEISAAEFKTKHGKSITKVIPVEPEWPVRIGEEDEFYEGMGIV